jgi:GNAT superfamily N-acetyltransferase
MTDDLAIETRWDPDEPDRRRVIEGLVAFNSGHAPPEQWHRVGAFVRDADGAVVGGTIGETHWNWLFVSHLWVDDAIRGRGLGRDLMRAMEEAAVAAGCSSVHLDTHDFQALPFYEHLGFEQFAVLDDYPTGHTRHFLRKGIGGR